MIHKEEKIQYPFKSLVFLTNRVARLLTQRIWQRVDAEEVEILPQHMGVLSDLWQQDGVRQQDLAVALIKDKATIARTIQFLEQKNILVRVADQQDKRNKRIYLTHKGKSLQEKLIPHAADTVEEATAEIAPEDLKICIQVLNRIYKNLNGFKCN
ncbi:MAG: MarR family winged helix-turn-helix transcriptional regulator [Saprospiraceae bacterium]